MERYASEFDVPSSSSSASKTTQRHVRQRNMERVCSYYVWRWNISADCNVQGRRQALIRGLRCRLTQTIWERFMGMPMLTYGVRYLTGRTPM